MILSIVEGQLYEFVNHKLEGKINKTRTCSSVQPLFQPRTQDLISANDTPRHPHSAPPPHPSRCEKTLTQPGHVSSRFEVITKPFFGG